MFRNVTKAGDKKVKFAQISSWLVAYNFGQPPLDSNSISCDNFNIPTIADVDGDGDVDIFSYQANEGNLLLYRNMTVDFKLPISPPVLSTPLLMELEFFHVLIKFIVNMAGVQHSFGLTMMMMAIWIY